MSENNTITTTTGVSPYYDLAHPYRYEWGDDGRVTAIAEDGVSAMGADEREARRNLAAIKGDHDPASAVRHINLMVDAACMLAEMSVPASLSERRRHALDRLAELVLDEIEAL